MILVVVRSGNSIDSHSRPFIPGGVAVQYLRGLQAEEQCVWAEAYAEKRFSLNGEEVESSAPISADGARIEIRLR